MVVIGHGILRDYSSQVQLNGPITVSEVLDMVGLPEDLRVSTTVIKDGRAVSGREIVGDDDCIYLFIMLDGG